MTAAGLRRWGDDLLRFRERIGFDFADPDGFSRYLIAAYSNKANDADRRLVNPGQVIRDYKLSPQDTRKAFRVWLRSLCSGNPVCARGLHGLSFLPGDDIPSMLSKGRMSPWDNYSMNVPVAVARFATKWVLRPQGMLTESWARGASAIDARAADAVLTSVGMTEEEYQYGSSYRSASDDPVPPWHTLSTSVKTAIRMSQCPVVIVSRVSEDDIKGAGTDSESGDTNEAEIHVKPCEPKCVEHIFVASAVHRLGSTASPSLRRLYGLDHHNVLSYRDDYGEGTLTLHSSVGVGRKVSNLPPQWTWYEV